MDRQLRRALLAGSLGLAVFTGLVRAQGPSVPPRPVTPEEYLNYPSMPVGPQGVPSGPVVYPQAHPAAEGAAKPRPVREWFRGHGLCCWSHHNEMGCGGWQSDLKFIFGSCRTFFGETCPRSAPPLPVPYRGDYYRDGCNCR